MSGTIGPGETFAGYRVESMVGRGGMGVVYRARQLRPSRLVAVKVIAPELAGDATFRRRFERESELAASIEHPNVIPVYEVDEVDGLLFIAMRFVEGADFRELIAQGLEPARAVRIVEQVAAALDAAHARGLVHRDVKPANVLVSEMSGGPHAYLTDFGLTRRTAASVGLTGSGAFLGTVDYAAPEQIRAEPMDARTDVYALTCVLYEALTGEVPYPRDSQVAKIWAHCEAPPPSVLAHGPKLPRGIDEVIRRGLAKRPEDRYASAGDLALAAIAAFEHRTVATGQIAPGSERPAEAVAGRTIGPGAAFAGYRVESLVGRGGMGVVYRATDLSLERPVALKLIAPELAQNERFRARFLREPRLAAALDHPNVVPIYEAGEREGQLYLAMRYVDGSDLKTMLEREGPLMPERVLPILAQIAGALDAAHRRGLVHRDVKPANVLLDADEHAYLTDFGVSKQLGIAASTETGRVVGTLDYLAPEQIRGEGVDGRTDCYALACVLFECLAGVPPFRRETEAETLWAHMQEEPAPLEGHPALEPVLRKALEKDREERFGTCAELIEAAHQAPATGSVQRAASAAPRLGEAATPVFRRRKTVTVLFCDCSASTGDVDPESLERVVGRRLDEMRSVIEGHGGTVERLASDAVVAVFGVPQLHEDDPLRAVRAAVELRNRLATQGAEIERGGAPRVWLRIGVGTGLVMAGQSSRGEPLLTGEVLNLAARLAQGARAGEILVAQRTWGLVEHAATAEPATDGGYEGAAAFSLVEVQPAGPRDAGRLESPMVGRRRELELLGEVFERVGHDRACHLFTLLGAAGVGKSRLVDELVGDLAGKAAVVRGRCLPYGEGITFWPIAELVKEAARLSDDDSVESARRKVRRLVEREEDADMLAERVIEVIGVAAATAEKEVSFWAVRRLCEALARERPLVVVFDDIQWGEATFLELVEHVADWSSDAPILLLCVARPELVETRPDWGGGKLNATSVLLEPLGRGDCEHLIENLLDRASLAESARAHIADATGGNPLFVEELVAMLVEAGFLSRTNGSWAAVRDLSLAPIPATIQALLVARLDRLHPDERALIERAAIEGEVFHRGAVAELAAGALEGDLGRCLMGLTRKELIRRDRASFAEEEAFRFRHLLLRDAAYESLPKDTRGELHERFATWLEQKAGERVSEHDEILGYHLEQGFRYREELAPLDEDARALGRRAADRLGAASGRALGRGDMPAAANLLERAASLLPPGEPSRRELQLQLGVALSEVGDIARADDVLTETVEAGAAAGDRRLEVRALVERSYWRHVTGRAASTDELGRALEEAIPVLERASDEAGLARACGHLAFVDSTACRWAAVAESYERGLLHARRAADAKQEIDLLWGLSAAFLYGPTPVEDGIHRFQQILDEVAEAAGGAATDRLGASSLAVVEATGLAGLEAMRGNVERARMLSARAKSIFTELGQTLKLAVLGQDAGWVELLAGAPGAAEAELRAGYEILEEMGETGYLSTTAAWLSEAVYAQGRYDESERLTEVAERTAARDDVYSLVLWRGTRAKVLARRGSLEPAGRLAREAVTLAAETDALNLHADSLLDLAEVMRLWERPAEAAASVAEALELFDAKGNLLSARRARALLEQLSR